MTPERFFIDCDHSCHWYVVPEAKRDKWEIFLELDEDDDRSWDVPTYAARIAGPINRVTFEKPQEIE